MNIFYSTINLKKEIQIHKNNFSNIGFVPTMGALHQGHTSLVKKAKSENNFCVASIFVNPTQFNNPEDLKKYPRTLETDLSMLEAAGCDVVFIPSVDEMYPEKDTRVFDFNKLDSVMEGQFRPGHFNGVGQIVSKLFDIVQPHKAYFGQKDFQQLAIIKYLAKHFMPELNIEIIACPIIREADGLAMSSRNLLLTPEHRKLAPVISQTLFKAVEIAKQYSVVDLKQWVIDQINQNELLKVEYFEIVDDTQLVPITNWDENNIKVGCIAVFAGHVRLIDNVIFS